MLRARAIENQGEHQVTASRLWTTYRKLAARDRRVRWGGAAAAAVLVGAAVLVPMLAVLVVVVALGTYGVLRSPLLDGVWAGDDVDDWA